MATRERVAWIFHEKAQNRRCLRRRRAIAANPKPPRASASSEAVGAPSPVLESTFSSPGASGACGASGESGTSGVSGLSGLPGLSGLSGTSGMVSIVEHHRICSSSVAAVHHLAREQVVSVGALLKRNLNGLYRLVHLSTIAASSSVDFSVIWYQYVPAMLRGPYVMTSKEIDTVCAVDRLGALPALNGIPAFVDLDKREGKGARRGFALTAIDKLKSARRPGGSLGRNHRPVRGNSNQVVFDLRLVRFLVLAVNEHVPPSCQCRRQSPRPRS